MTGSECEGICGMLHGERSYSASLPPLVSALPSARLHFSSWMSGAALPASFIEDLEVVFSELVTNAVHASAAGADVLVRAGCTGGHLVLEVLNAVRGRHTSVRRWDLSDQLREGGRGLMIVRAFVDEIETDREGDRVVVRCRRAIDRL